MISQLIHITWGKLRGKGWDKKVKVWGQLSNPKLSPILASYTQSYPQSFTRPQQRVVRQSTDSTTITTLINIY